MLLGELCRGTPPSESCPSLDGRRVGEEVEHGAARGPGRCGGVSVAHRLERSGSYSPACPAWPKSRMRSAINACIASRAGFR